MKAMVLAAGLGTRLRPLTNDRPKALVEVGGPDHAGDRPRTLAYLRRERSDRQCRIISPKWCASYLEAHEKFGMRIEISREEIVARYRRRPQEGGMVFSRGRQRRAVHRPQCGRNQRDRSVPGWCDSTGSKRPWRRWQCRRGQRIARCCSMRRASCAGARKLRA